jgi:hypothetical protein
LDNNQFNTTHLRPRPRPAWLGANNTTSATAPNRDIHAVPTYNFESTPFDFQFPPPSKHASSSNTTRRLPDIPDPDRSPSSAWGLDDDVIPAGPKGKKRQIEEVMDKPSKTKHTSSSTTQRLPDIPDLDRSPSPAWSFGDNPADVTPADPRGKKPRIEEVVDKPSKAKPRRKATAAATGKSVAKKPRKGTAKQEVKKEVKGGSSNGRKPGAAGYSEKEIMKLLQLIQKYLPIGGAGWDLVMVQYNRWAKKNEFSCDRARKALRTKFDAVYYILHRIWMCKC